MKNVKISVVIPVYNSGECVEELTRQLAEALKGFSYEQIMVNDCSRDDSWQKISEVIKKGYPVVGINLRKNSGQDNALFAGLSNASGDWIVIMDDDLQHSPYDIPALYNKALEGYDVCYADFPRKKQALWKNIGSAFNGMIAELVIDKPKGLYLSPFKIIRGEVVAEMIKSTNLFPYIDGLIFEVTHNITQISVEHHERAAGVSNYNLIKSIKVFCKLLFGFSVAPLRIAAGIGTLSAGCGFLLAVYVLIRHFIRPEEVEGWTSMILLMLILGGLILVSLGVLGEYIGRMYLTVNSYHRYTIAEIKNGTRKQK